MLSGARVSIAGDENAACSLEARVQPGEDAADDVAAWYLRCPAGRLIVHRDGMVARVPGGEYAIQTGLLETATDLAGHTHTTDLLPAVPAGATPLLRSDECRRRRG
jgi:butyrate kinase